MLVQVMVSFACIGSLHGLFHADNFFIRQRIEVVQAFPCGNTAIVLQTKADKKVDFSVGHVCDLLDGTLCHVVMGQKCQFAKGIGAANRRAEQAITE